MRMPHMQKGPLLIRGVYYVASAMKTRMLHIQKGALVIRDVYCVSLEGTERSSGQSLAHSSPKPPHGDHATPPAAPITPHQTDSPKCVPTPCRYTPHQAEPTKRICGRRAQKGDSVARPAKSPSRWRRASISVILHAVPHSLLQFATSGRRRQDVCLFLGWVHLAVLADLRQGVLPSSVHRGICLEDPMMSGCIGPHDQHSLTHSQPSPFRPANPFDHHSALARCHGNQRRLWSASLSRGRTRALQAATTVTER